MMTKILVSGWKPGFQKVNFTFLLQRELGYSLRQAKAETDAVMDERAVELSVPGEANAFVQSLHQLGAKFEVVVSSAR